jgi:hypothetical protein
MERTGIAVWDEIEIPQKTCVAWHFPSRSIWVERVESEWHVLSLPGDPSLAEARSGPVVRARKPTSSQWRHYLHRETGAVRPAPVLPDRPVVVRPDRWLTLLPGQSTVFFLELPLWFRLSTTGPHAARVFEEPLGVLTRTWFGDAITGELCWGLATRLHHSLESVDLQAARAVCPLTIENDSDTDLVFEKICLHVENLSLYRGPHRLWTNSLRAVFKGPDQATQIEISPEPPTHEGNLVLLSPARQQVTGWSFRRTFGMLRSFTEI